MVRVHPIGKIDGRRYVFYGVRGGVVNAPDCGSGFRRFESCRSPSRRSCEDAYMSSCRWLANAYLVHRISTEVFETSKASSTLAVGTLNISARYHAMVAPGDDGNLEPSYHGFDFVQVLISHQSAVQSYRSRPRTFIMTGAGSMPAMSAVLQDACALASLPQDADAMDGMSPRLDRI